MTDLVPKLISKSQARDTGMAMVLILLIIGHTQEAGTAFFSAATVVLLIDMIWPMFFKPVAYVWLTFSNVLGAIMSKLLLSIVFFVVVTPIGVIRRILGEDLMRGKEWKKDSHSVFVTRDKVFCKKDLENLF